MDQLRDALRSRHYSRRTEQAYCPWVRRYIRGCISRDTPRMSIIESKEFEAWLTGVRGPVTRARILARIKRLGEGNRGEVRSVGCGVFELRVHFGPGYRISFVENGREFVMLLVGGDKHTQRKDIAKAIRLAGLI